MIQQRLADLSGQLQASQQEATKYRTEAETVQALLQRLNPAPAAKSTRRKPAV